VNDLDALGEPVVRRMDLAIRFSTPPTATLRRLARKTMARNKCSATDATVDRLAAMRASPAIISAAVRTSRRIGWDDERLMRVTSDLAEASGRYSSEQPRTAGARFDPGLSRSDHDLTRIAARLAGTNRPWSLLLSGPPGTGKTAFGHHLAEVSGCDLLIKNGSDLLGCFVGQTEAAIAGAFREAQRSNAILLIDEADSFLTDRSRARQQWEASMVNEMLRQMDAGRARFIATTNRAELLDRATARRFTLNIRFTAMTVDQAAAMFELRFGQPCPAALRRIEGLTPGDFAQAADRASLLGGAEGAELLRWLEGAVADREEGRPIGF
jgi:SpoVK/Ycf46/Vps4 family AAA+-type ATPase